MFFTVIQFKSKINKDGNRSSKTLGPKIFFYIYIIIQERQRSWQYFHGSHFFTVSCWWASKQRPLNTNTLDVRADFTVETTYCKCQRVEVMWHKCHPGYRWGNYICTYLQKVLLPGSSWKVPKRKVSLLYAAAHTETAARLQHVTMEQANGSGSKSGWAVLGIGKSTVLPAEVHHEPELPEGPHRAEQGNQKILIGISWDLADKYLTADPWGRTVPHWEQNRDRIAAQLTSNSYPLAPPIHLDSPVVNSRPTELKIVFFSGKLIDPIKSSFASQLNIRYTDWEFANILLF